MSRTDTRAVQQHRGVSDQYIRSATEKKTAPVQAPSAAQFPIGLIRGLDGMAPTPLFGRRGGCSPRDFGMSRECAKLRRKNKLRRLGIGGDRY